MVRQQEGETIDMFLTELRNLAATCDFGPIHEDLVLYKIVDGTRSLAATERMLRKGSELTLERAMDICRAEELTRQEMSMASPPLNSPDTPPPSARRQASPSPSALRRSNSSKRPERSISFRSTGERSISFPEGLDTYYDDDEPRSPPFCISDGGGGGFCNNNNMDISVCRGSNGGGTGFHCTPRARTPVRRRGGMGSGAGKCGICSCASTPRRKGHCTAAGDGSWRNKCRRQPLMDTHSRSAPSNSCCNSCVGEPLYQDLDTTYDDGDDDDGIYQNAADMHNTTPDVEVRVPVVTYSDYPAVEIPRNNEFNNTRTEIMFVLKINGKLVRAQMGARAEVDVMPKRVFDLVADAGSTLSAIPMEHDPGEDITVYGSIEMVCSYKDHRVAVNFYVMDTDTITMLTSHTCAQLGVI